MPPPELPTIPGREVAGVVDLVGDGVDPTWLGRRVVAHLGLVPGGYAEQAVTTPDQLFPVPDHVDLAEAVAMVGTGRTAQGILELEPPDRGDTVLVPAAAGGLGWLLVQAARASGARVVAAARGDDKLARLKELEPDLVVDYGDDAWADEVRRGVGGVVPGVRRRRAATSGRTAWSCSPPAAGTSCSATRPGTPTRFDTATSSPAGSASPGASGARMVALPGGIPGPGRPRARAARRR